MNSTVKREPESVPIPDRIEYLIPAVNIYETADGYQLEADMPGVTKEGLEISLDRNELTLLGHRKTTTPETVHYRESVDGSYRRVFELNPEINADKISARVDNGVLTLTLAKREHVKPRKVTVSD